MQGYLYDPHTHTAETSKCGHLPAADVVERYVKHGFSGLVVTDHLHPEYLSRIDTEHDWQKAMDHYLSGYKASKKRGDELGFDVILGAELRFPQNDNDYLVYGIDEDWLRSNPYMCCTSAREFYEKLMLSKDNPLKALTDDCHYHTVAAPSERLLDLIEQELRHKGFLCEPK